MAEIKFVRHYCSWGYDWYDVVYASSNRLVKYEGEKLPETVKKFMKKCDCKEQYSSIFKRDEWIYQLKQDTRSDLQKALDMVLIRENELPNICVDRLKQVVERYEKDMKKFPYEVYFKRMYESYKLILEEITKTSREEN